MILCNIKVYATDTADLPSKYELALEPANKAGTMTEEQIEVIYYYKLKSTKVIVHHYEEGTTIKLSEDVEIEGLIDSTYTTTSADDIPIKYVLSQRPENATGIMTEEVIEVTYYYAVKDAELNIYYLEKDTDIELAKPEKQTGKVGEMYRTDAKEIEGYTLVENSGNTTGQLEVEPLTVIYYYLKNTRATVQYIDITTGEILDERTDEGLVGDEFVTETKNFTDYILVSEPEQKTVNMTKEEIVLKYYYLHISGGVIEQHIDVISGDVLYNGTHEGNEGDEYNILSKTFTGYDLVEVPTNKEGTMTDDVTEVIYYYVKPAKVIANYYDIDTKETIAAEEVIDGHESDEYETVQKEIKYYNLVEVPENKAGNMTVEDIVVNYYYKKKDFNLKVEKQVKEIAYNGQVLSVNGNIGKVELDKNKIASTEMVVTYEIKVTNTAELKGGAELIENIPNGMTMNEADNKTWVIHEDTAILSVEDLEPGQERSYNVVMRWTPSENNLGMKENIAEIVKVDNEAGFEEITIEDNKGKADLVISIKTGAEDDNTIVKLAILVIFIVLGITVTCIIIEEKNRK